MKPHFLPLPVKIAAVIAVTLLYLLVLDEIVAAYFAALGFSEASIEVINEAGYWAAVLPVAYVLIDEIRVWHCLAGWSFMVGLEAFFVYLI